MRYLALTLLIVLFLRPSSKACDACGCGSGGNYIGIVPQFNSSFVGVRFNERSFRSKGTPSIFNDIPVEKDQVFATTEVWGKVAIGNRWQFFGFIPYQYSTEKAVGTHSAKPVQGLGDVSALINYSLLNNRDSLFSKTRFNWQLVGGVKMPTGSYETLTPAISIAQQPGSGSWDYTAGSILTLRRYTWGMHTDVWYRLNGTGYDKHRFGDRFSSSMKAFYWKNIRQYTFLPNIGLLYEHNASEISKNVIQKYSGGDGIFALAGVENYYGRYSFGLTYMQPLIQHFSKNTVTANARIMLSLTCSFGQSKN